MWRPSRLISSSGGSSFSTTHPSQWTEPDDTPGRTNLVWTTQFFFWLTCQVIRRGFRGKVTCQLVKRNLPSQAQLATFHLFPKHKCSSHFEPRIPCQLDPYHKERGPFYCYEIRIKIDVDNTTQVGQSDQNFGVLNPAPGEHTR